MNINHYIMTASDYFLLSNISIGKCSSKTLLWFGRLFQVAEITQKSHNKVTISIIKRRNTTDAYAFIKR